MKKITLLFLLFTAGNAFSQDTIMKQKSSPEKIAKAEFKMLKERITDLTKPQEDSLQTVYTEYAAGLTAIQERRNKRGKLMVFEKAGADKSDKIKKILTAQQWPIYEKLNDDVRQKMMERRKKNI